MLIKLLILSDAEHPAGIYHSGRIDDDAAGRLTKTDERLVVMPTSALTTRARAARCTELQRQRSDKRLGRRREPRSSSSGTATSADCFVAARTAGTPSGLANGGNRQRLEVAAASTTMRRRSTFQRRLFTDVSILLVVVSQAMPVLRCAAATDGESLNNSRDARIH